MKPTRFPSVLLSLALAAASLAAPARAAESAAEAYARLRAEAGTLAGAPSDIARRAPFLAEIYRDSGGNHEFPLVALHGALWAERFFSVTGPAADRIRRLFFLTPWLVDPVLQTLKGFQESLQAANRAVFVDTYANYWFTREHGREPGARSMLRSELLGALNRVHRAREAGAPLDEDERAEVFDIALAWEQEETVTPRVSKAVADIPDSRLRNAVVRPIVRFEYFPATEVFFFRDFSDKEERIYYATRAHEIAAQAGWPRVIASLRDYRVLPAAYFSDPAGYTAGLRASLLGGR